MGTHPSMPIIFMSVACRAIIVLQLAIKKKLPREVGFMDDELLVITSELSGGPLIGVRGRMDWSHVVRHLQPSTRYKIRFSLRAEMVGHRAGVFTGRGRDSLSSHTHQCIVSTTTYVE